MLGLNENWLTNCRLNVLFLLTRHSDPAIAAKALVLFEQLKREFDIKRYKAFIQEVKSWRN